jgi:hypothetical protein
MPDFIYILSQTKMSQTEKKLVNIGFLLIFLCLTLTINFFHTEKTPDVHHACPACQFQANSLAIQTIHFFTHPELQFLENVKTVESFTYIFYFSLSLSSRSPPQV